LEIRDIAAYISLHDNVALLTTFPGSTLDFDIYGLKLDSLETIPLIQAEGDNNSPVVVDDWLIWIKDGHLASKRLPGSMSGSPSP
jgi:hypothetical protein